MIRQSKPGRYKMGFETFSEAMFASYTREENPFSPCDVFHARVYEN